MSFCGSPLLLYSRLVNISDYWLPRPEFELEVSSELETLYAECVVTKQGDWLNAPLPVPKWVFLNWLADEKGLLLHGTGDAAITTFEPCTPFDNSPDDFSKQTAVFAAGDGIWAIFYAVIDRVNFRLRMLNGALQFEAPDGWTPVHYFFSVTEEVLKRYPWREGVVYVLPSEGFVRQPPYVLGKHGRILEPHYANPNPVQPLVKLHVTPEDFPLLAQVRGHDNDEVMANAAREPYGFPWLK